MGQARAKRGRRPGALPPALRLLVAIALAASGSGLLAGSSPGPARAAAPSLTLVTAAMYAVLPAERRVAVTVRITATNHLSDTVTRRFFFEEGYLSVLPGTSNFRLTAPTGSPSVTVVKAQESGVLLRLRFGSRLAAGKSLDLTLTFDLVDPGGAPDRAVRISPSLVLFQAWGCGSDATPGSSVEVRVPAGYTVDVARGPLIGPTADLAGNLTFVSGPLDAPLTFVADVTAARPGDYLGGRRSTSVGDRTVILVLRSWPDDPTWYDRVGDLLTRTLAVLGEDIGAPWLLADTVTVEETLGRAGSDAGDFDPEQALMSIGYKGSPSVVLHTAAHAWFNGRLVADRWIAEAFASYYAERAAAALGVAIESPDLADTPAGVAIALNAWAPMGEATTAEDAYGLAASLALAREIAAVVGDQALRDTWRAAALGAPAYQAGSASAAPSSEAGAGPPDWRGLLDLLQDQASPGGNAALDRLWRRWVIRPGDAAVLDARAGARESYAAALEAAAPWALPRSIRDAMRAWQFGSAREQIADAGVVLRQRAAVAAAASTAGLRPPPALRHAFEGDDGLAVASAEAATELATLHRLEEAAAARIDEPSLVDRLGLLGVEPGESLTAARAAFEDGDLNAAIAGAADAEAAWTAAPEVGRGRIISGLLLAMALLLLAELWLQRRRRRNVARH